MQRSQNNCHPQSERHGGFAKISAAVDRNIFDVHSRADERRLPSCDRRHSLSTAKKANQKRSALTVLPTRVSADGVTLITAWLRFPHPRSSQKLGRELLTSRSGGSSLFWAASDHSNVLAS